MEIDKVLREIRREQMEATARIVNAQLENDKKYRKHKKTWLDIWNRV